MICSRCTRAGRGWVARHPVEDALDEISDRHEHGHEEYILDCSACAACCAELKAFVADYNRRGRS